MSETAGAASFSKLGFAKGQVIQEFGYDDDVDNDLRFGLEDVIGTELEDEDFNDGADVRTGDSLGYAFVMRASVTPPRHPPRPPWTTAPPRGGPGSGAGCDERVSGAGPWAA